MMKITGWPRMGFLEAAFPGAVFVHLIRDGRAVANSLLKVDFWRGYEGTSNWRRGPLPGNYESEWMASGRSFVALAAIQWKMILDAVRTSEAMIKGTVLEVRYQDLCREPAVVVENICQFAGIEFEATLRSALLRQNLVSADHKWRQDLDLQQQRILQDCLHQSLREYGFSDEKEMTSS